jgi:uncharacterized protein
MMPSRVIALFVKPPLPGRVKTRLSRAIGDQAASAIYCSFVAGTIDQVITSKIPLILCYDGKQDDLPANWSAPAWHCLAQTESDDLGERMAHTFSSLFTDGVEQVVLIGSDIPDIDSAYLQRAFELLGDHNLVIGPALDGGYCLVGFNRNNFTPELFVDIPWSTNRVFERTLQSAAAAGLSTALLPPLRDIDTIEDLRCCNALPLALNSCFNTQKNLPEA